MTGERPLVLIADDEKDIRFILRETLAPLGYRVIEAADGRQARQAVERDRPDLVLLDVRIPVVDGMTILRELRASALDVGIVIMTAHGNERLAVDAMKEGADDYLPKPFDPDEVAMVVERVLHHREVERTSAALSREFEREKRRLEAIFSQMNQGLLTTRPDLTIDSCNPRAEAILGIPRGRILGRSLQAMFPGLFAGLPPGEIPAAATSGTGAEVEVLLPDGSVRPILISCATIAPANGDEGGTVTVFQDLSSIRALEKEKAEFVSMMAHDLKGPLTSIFATNEMLLEGTMGEIDERQREFLTIAHTNTVRIRKMIDSFLEVYRLESGKVPFAMSPLSPADLVEQARERFVPVASERDISFSTGVEPGLPKVRGDAEHLARVFDNLLSNAFKFTPAGGNVRITAGRDAPSGGRLLRVAVEDDGPGIPAIDLPRIFEKFGQGRRRSDSGGVGLGLAYCRMAVERHGGTISARSGATGGTEIAFTLPFEEPIGS